jgi:hypothetical protein
MNNPIPMWLIGAGLCWLFLKNTGSARVTQDARLIVAGRRSERAVETRTANDYAVLDRAGFGPSKPSVQIQAVAATRFAVGAVNDVILDRVWNYAKQKFERDPLLIGVAGLIAGALIGALLPQTQIEENYFRRGREKSVTRLAEIGDAAAEIGDAAAEIDAAQHSREQSMHL